MPSVAGVQSTLSADQYLQIGAARLRYRDEGVGPALVLIHGWTLDLEMWDAQVAALRDSFRLVRFDRRGFGLSSGTPAIEADVEDLKCLCRHLALQRTALVGMSQGARAVLQFALAAPHCVSALILDGPPALDAAAPDEDVAVAQFRALVHSHGIEAFRREWRRHPLMQLRTEDRAMVQLLRRMLDRYPGRDLLGPAAAVPPEEPRPALGSLGMPALVLTGELDLPSRIASADALSRRLPNAERRSIAAAGHLPGLDNPAVYNQLCRTFLARHLSPTDS